MAEIWALNQLFFVFYFDTILIYNRIINEVFQFFGIDF